MRVHEGGGQFCVTGLTDTGKWYVAFSAREFAQFHLPSMALLEYRKCSKNYNTMRFFLHTQKVETRPKFPCYQNVERKEPNRVFLEKLDVEFFFGGKTIKKTGENWVGASGGRVLWNRALYSVQKTTIVCDFFLDTQKVETHQLPLLATNKIVRRRQYFLQNWPI